MRGQAPFTYKWFKNGNMIPKSSKENSNDKFSALVIDPIKPTSAGNYTCVVTNAYGSSSYSALLVVRCEYKTSTCTKISFILFNPLSVLPVCFLTE